MHDKSEKKIKDALQLGAGLGGAVGLQRGAVNSATLKGSPLLRYLLQKGGKGAAIGALLALPFGVASTLGDE